MRCTLASVLLLALCAPQIASAESGDAGGADPQGMVRLLRPNALPVRHDETIESNVIDLVRDHADALGIRPALADGLQLSARSRPAAGLANVHIVTVEGRFGSIPLARPVARAITAAGRARLLVGAGSVGRLTYDETAAVISPEEALARLGASGLPGSLDATEARLAALPRGEQTNLAWLIDPPVDLQHVTNPLFAVDAMTATIDVLFDRVQMAYVRSFDRNPFLDPAPGIYLLNHIDTSAQSLEGPFFVARNCIDLGYGNCEPQPTATPDAQGDFLYPAPDVGVPADNTQPEDTFAEVSMYYHADKFLSWMQSLGFTVLRCHQQGQRATLVANFKLDGPFFDNAFYSGDCAMTMVFGQGSEVDFAYDGDVVYHELGHGVVERQMDGSFLGFGRPRPDALVQDAGALNEAFADFVSSAFAGDSVVGDYIGAYWSVIDGPGVRDNDNEFKCPDDLIGEVHVDSEPFAGALWDAYRILGPGVVTVALDTMAALAEDATLEEAAVIFEELAGIRLGQDAADLVHGLLAERGLFDCPRVTGHENLRGPLFVQPPYEFDPFAPPPMQLLFQVPADADTVDLYFAVAPYAGPFGSGGFVEAHALVKRGERITFDYDDGVYPPLVSSNADEIHENVTDGHLTISATAGARVYVGFVNTGSDVMMVDDIRAEYSQQGSDPGDTTTPGDPGTGTATDSGQSGTGSLGGGGDGKREGCGCAQQRVDNRLPAALFGLWLLRTRRKRRQNRRSS
jgi:hypothetical protein